MSLTDINIYTLKQVRTKRRLYDLEDCNITCPLACYKVIQYTLNLKSEPVEKFGIISQSAKNKLLGIHIIGTGVIDHVQIEPRDVFMAAMMNNAKAIIAFHNHPSGDPTPSQGDIILTQRLKEAGELMCIELMDHLITGEESYISLQEAGLLKV
jgi:DNA repair protein RadC